MSLIINLCTPMWDIIREIWNTISGVINSHIGESITYHDVLHGFLTDRGTRTASLESKLLHQLKAMREGVLYKVFLEL